VEDCDVLLLFDDFGVVIDTMDLTRERGTGPYDDNDMPEIVEGPRKLLSQFNGFPSRINFL
jgi:hypothetical protein